MSGIRETMYGDVGHRANTQGSIAAAQNFGPSPGISLKNYSLVSFCAGGVKKDSP